MPSDSLGDGASAPEPAFSEGFRLDNPSVEDLRAALDAAFDYRGDVTLFLHGDEPVVGYIFNRSHDGAEPHLEILPRDGDAKRRVPYDRISGLYFSGRDTASGRSWETWVKLYNEKKAARERGEDVGVIGISPEPLE